VSAPDPEVSEHPITRAIRRQAEGYTAFFYDAFVNLAVNGITGDYVEFGSWGASTLNIAYQQGLLSGRPRHLWAFDSFEGLPPAEDPRDEHPGWQPGSDLGQGGVARFHEACAAHGIPVDAYTAVEGYYSDSLPPLGADQPPVDIALAYVDCNMYTSTVEVLRFLEPRLKHGMILAFDDYFCWSPTNVSAERSAFHEFRLRLPQWHFERYKDVHRAGVSFVVERADLLPPA
jgi:hypothetical protein